MTLQKPGGLLQSISHESILQFALDNVLNLITQILLIMIGVRRDVQLEGIHSRSMLHVVQNPADVSQRITVEGVGQEMGPHSLLPIGGDFS